MKEREEKNVENYRPQSLLHSISKVFKKAMNARFTEYLEEGKLLYKGEHGVPPGMSTITAAIHFVESTIASVDSHANVIGISMYLSKVFDRVCHPKLIYKLT